MTKIQVVGPKRNTKGPVTYQQTFTRSQTHLDSQFMVTINLGDHLRHQVNKSNQTSDRLNGSPARRVGLTSHSENGNSNGELTLNKPSITSRSVSELPKQLSERKDDHSKNSNLQLTKILPQSSNGGPNLTAPFIAPFVSRDSQATDNTDADNDSESDLEILEVRPLRPSSVQLSSNNTYVSRDLQDEDSDSDISCLDEEINQALSSTTTIPTQKSQPSKLSLINPIFKLLPNLCKQVGERSPPPLGFRNIPPNLVNAIQRELNFFYDNNTDDDVEIVGKMTFSLKDPIARTKIRLPIKATTCRHFECFDFYNFCLFYELSTGTRNGLKTNMLLQSKESRECEEKFYRQQRQIAEGKMLIKSPGLVFPLFSEHGQMFFTDVYSRTPPLYKCPLCDEKFGLKQLYISDVFNFFVKTTPAHISKIELVENDRYKIVEEETAEKSEEKHDVVELDDDDDEDEDAVQKTNVQTSVPKVRAENKHLNGEIDSKLPSGAALADRSVTSEDFNDGLDDVLLGLKQGDGSWFHPLTLD